MTQTEPAPSDLPPAPDGAPAWLPEPHYIRCGRSAEGAMCDCEDAGPATAAGDCLRARCDC